MTSSVTVCPRFIKHHAGTAFYTYLVKYFLLPLDLSVKKVIAIPRTSFFLPLLHAFSPLTLGD